MSIVSSIKEWMIEYDKLCQKYKMGLAGGYDLPYLYGFGFSITKIYYNARENRVEIYDKGQRKPIVDYVKNLTIKDVVEKSNYDKH